MMYWPSGLHSRALLISCIGQGLLINRGLRAGTGKKKVRTKSGDKGRLQGNLNSGGPIAVGKVLKGE